MTEWIDQKYIFLIAPKLKRFKQKGPKLFNFRCPICNDSSKNQYKSRGYIYSQDNEYWFKCHNCNKNFSLKSLIRKVDPTLYTDYIFERYKENAIEILNKGNSSKVPDPPIYDDDIFKTLPRISTLPDTHEGVQFIKKRKIPQHTWDRLLWTDDAVSLIRHFKPEKFKDTSIIEGGIVIPCYTIENRVNYFQIRLLNSIKDGLRYITTTIDESKPKIFGLNQLITSERYYIIEGPFDSLFIPNSVAMMGSHINYDFPKEHAVFVYDNEPRNKEIIGQVSRRIKEGYGVCIWPSTIEQKDINDMVLAGYTADQVKSIIDSNILCGLSAELKLSEWKKV